MIVEVMGVRLGKNARDSAYSNEYLVSALIVWMFPRIDALMVGGELSL